MGVGYDIAGARAAAVQKIFKIFDFRDPGFGDLAAIWEPPKWVILRDLNHFASFWYILRDLCRFGSFCEIFDDFGAL